MTSLSPQHRSRLHSLLDSLPLSRLAAPPSSPAATSALPDSGFLYLTRNPDPIAFFIDRVKDDVTPIRLVMDERCFEETLIRVTRTATTLVLHELVLLNGTRPTRTDHLAALHANAYTSVPVFESYKLVLGGCQGEAGEFVSVVRTDVPDVYRVSEGGYLRVPTLALSRHLRRLGDRFQIRATHNPDGTWTISSPSTNEVPS